MIIKKSIAVDHWCSISYYELDSQVGETFKVRREMTEILVDGGMDPHGQRDGRFCLGALSNVHRSEASEKIRWVAHHCMFTPFTTPALPYLTITPIYHTFLIIDTVHTFTILCLRVAHHCMFTPSPHLVHHTALMTLF